MTELTDQQLAEIEARDAQTVRDLPATSGTLVVALRDRRALLAEVRRQREALDKVRALHVAVPPHRNLQQYCQHCRTAFGLLAPWPCPTARVLGES